MTESVNDTLNDTERMLIEQACTRLVNLYCHTLDAGEFDAFVELFAEDAVWTLQSTGPMRGRKAIRGYLAKRDPKTRSRHIATNIVVDVIDASNATSRSYTTAYRHVGTEPVPPLSTPSFIALSRDRFRRDPAGWRIVARETQVVFSRPV
jgi:ketosteroid isomerase-like protein